MKPVKIKKGDEVKFDVGSLFPRYGTVKRVNKITYTIVDTFGNTHRIEKCNVWFD